MNPIPTSDWDPLDTNGRHLYLRYLQNVMGRVEKILSQVCVRVFFGFVVLLSLIAEIVEWVCFDVFLRSLSWIRSKITLPISIYLIHFQRP